MPVFKKKSDPIAARSKELNDQIHALEAQIKQLSGNLHEERIVTPRAPTPTVPLAPRHEARRESIFERVDPPPAPEAAPTSGTGHYNDLGIRKYDVFGSFRRWRKQIEHPSTANPKLVSYLAAGSIRGLRPLRYEKRIARNRFLVLSTILVLFLWGILSLILKNR